MRHVRLRADVEGGVLVDLVPGATWGFQGGVELAAFERFAARLAVLATGQTAATLAPGAADVALLAGRLDACATRATDARTRLGVAACAGVAAGRLLARGRGYDAPREATLPWLAGVARLELRLAVAPWIALRLGVDGYVPALATRLVVLDGAGAVIARTTLAPVAFGAQLGVAMTFW